MRLAISRESLILFIVCAMDAASTIALVLMGKATEANPLMAKCLEYGIAQFCLVKLGSVLPAVVLAEWYRRRNPLFVRKVIRMGIAAYVGLYLGLLIAVNAA